MLAFLELGNEGIILLIFLIATIIQLYYYLSYFNTIAFHKEQSNKGNEMPVSVIIAAKNEAQNLKIYLPLILNQEYSKFELILINDGSTDDTDELVAQIKNVKLRYYKLEGEGGKKNALTYGIGKAQYEYLVFTDADCKVSSTNWLGLISQQLFGKKEIVLGHARFFRRKGILNSIIRFECLLNATQYLSHALKAKAYMGVGRNLAYKKEVFEKSTSFKTHCSIKSGDDDLLVNEMANSTNVGVVLSADSHTFSEAESSLKSYFRQKRRQLQAGAKYKKSDKLNLAIFGASNFIYYSLLVILLLNEQLVVYILGIFVVKQLIEYFLFRKINRKLGDSDLTVWIPVLEPVYLLLITLVGVSTWIWKVERWK